MRAALSGTIKPIVSWPGPIGALGYTRIRRQSDSHAAGFLREPRLKIDLLSGLRRILSLNRQGESGIYVEFVARFALDVQCFDVEVLGENLGRCRNGAPWL